MPSKANVKLLNYFQKPLNIAAASAMSCYSSHLVTDEEVEKKISCDRRDRVLERTYKAGHNTTLNHSYFHFSLENVSRLFLWSFLHNHPFYNSDQVSQRYVEVKPENIYIPPFSSEGKRIFEEAVADAFSTYTKLTDILIAVVEKHYKERFPSRLKKEKTEKKYSRDIRKKAQEAARYLLPLSVTAHLHHTISALVLHRYRKAASLSDCPEETKEIVGEMCRLVKKIEPDFFKFDDEPFEFDLQNKNNKTAVRRFDSASLDYASLDSASLIGIKERLSEFDSKLGDKSSLLIDAPNNLDAFMTALQTSNRGMYQDKSIQQIISEHSKSKYFYDSVNSLYHDNLSKALSVIRLTFMKKISISADSQNQRHRTITRITSRLIEQIQFTTPDYVIVPLIKESSEAEDLYREFMERLWRNISKLQSSGEKDEYLLYLLPNAFPVRFIETGDFLSYRHKWMMRLCLNAQEEIWRASVEEVKEILNRFPELAEYLGAPCILRRRANIVPSCPEGPGYCGVPLWKKALFEMERVI